MKTRINYAKVSMVVEGMHLVCPLCDEDVKDGNSHTCEQETLKETVETPKEQSSIHPPKTNPADCICEYTHCSYRGCRSKEVSRGGIKEEDREYPAPK